MRNGLRFALIGDDVGYSKSPAIFAAIFNHLGKEGGFDLAQVRQSQLESSLKQLVLEGYRGFSVTIPHKQALLAFLDDVDPVAQRVEAVNCVMVDDSRLFGYNTDSYGFSFPLLRDSRKTIGERVMIVGCGGAARAVAHSLYTDFGVRRLTVRGRSLPVAEKFGQALEQRYDKLKVLAELMSFSSPTESAEFDMVINCTPLGGFKFPDQSPFGVRIPLSNGGIYYDLNYNDTNKLVISARAQGSHTINGSQMLVAQAVKSFKIWTGLDAPVEAIYPLVFANSIVTPATSE